MSRLEELDINTWTLRQLLFKEFTPAECSTPNVVASASGDYEDFVNIDNISRNYFLMMIKFNESNALRNLFAEETFIDENGDKASGYWRIVPRKFESIGVEHTHNGETFYYYGPIAPDTLTRHFMTEGISLYSFNLGNKQYRFVVTGEDMRKHSKRSSDNNDTCAADSPVDNPEPGEKIILDATLAKALGNPNKNYYSVFKLFEDVEKLRWDPKSVMDQFTVLERWPGCGMKIPLNIRIELRPNLVWPTLELVTMDEEGNRSRIRLANEANEARWEDQSLEGDKQVHVGRVISTDKVQQGQTKAILRVKGKVLNGKAPEGVETAPGIKTEYGNVTAVATEGAPHHRNKNELHAEAKFEAGKDYEIVFGLPFICASFDVLTGLELSTEDYVTDDSDNVEEIILFTT